MVERRVTNTNIMGSTLRFRIRVTCTAALNGVSAVNQNIKLKKRKLKNDYLNFVQKKFVGSVTLKRRKRF